MNDITDKAADFLGVRKSTVMPIVAVLAMVGFGRIARLASIGLAAIWLVEQIKDVEGRRSPSQLLKAADKKVDDYVEDSFPASDAPSYSPSQAGSGHNSDNSEMANAI